LACLNRSFYLAAISAAFPSPWMAFSESVILDTSQLILSALILSGRIGFILTSIVAT